MVQITVSEVVNAALTLVVGAARWADAIQLLTATISETDHESRRDTGPDPIDRAILAMPLAEVAVDQDFAQTPTPPHFHSTTPRQRSPWLPTPLSPGTSTS
jgi:hypothetical protein